MSDNGSKEEVRKRCPFLNAWCIGDACALSTQMNQRVGGQSRQFASCAFTSLVLIMSELNTKAPMPKPQRIELPGHLRA